MKQNRRCVRQKGSSVTQKNNRIVPKFTVSGALNEAMSERDQAGSCYQRALESSRAQHARLFELRASLSLARLWRDQGKRAEARDLLAPIY
jgi:hypothetical protein